jgi:hypothetical protein
MYKKTSRLVEVFYYYCTIGTVLDQVITVVVQLRLEAASVTGFGSKAGAS